MSSGCRAQHQLDVFDTPGVSTTAFAYQVKLGLSYNVDPKTALFLQYRYMGTSGLAYGGARVSAGGGVWATSTSRGSDPTSRGKLSNALMSRFITTC
ncbi:MAG: P44/Msp2 family outer membrane protein [Proteobacteria bacterium]|nr:P44/Msp2 family outer membrane protein [Pseudomonadota bacterium]